MYKIKMNTVVIKVDSGTVLESDLLLYKLQVQTHLAEFSWYLFIRKL